VTALTACLFRRLALERNRMEMRIARKRLPHIGVARLTNLAP
jgi:hypothetical protein